MGKKVLIIDDEHDMLELMRFTLQKGGFEVSTCDNGRHALDEIIRVKPDLLILDVMLPGIDGYSLQIKIAEDAALRELPIIVVTSLEPSKTLFQKFPQVVSFMTKPFKTDDLLQAALGAVSRPLGPGS